MSVRAGLAEQPVGFNNGEAEVTELDCGDGSTFVIKGRDHLGCSPFSVPLWGAHALEYVRRKVYQESGIPSSGETDLRHESMRGARDGALLVALLLLAAPLEAQWTRRPPPPESAYWWTLTDSASPAELRHALQDREVNRERFRRGSAQGALDKQVTEQQVYEVSVYLDGQRNPELVPMYLAFESFAARFDYRPEWTDRSVVLMAEHGLSAAGGDAILDSVQQYSETKERIIAEVKDPVGELMAMLEPLLSQHGNEQLTGLLVEGNLRELAQLTGREVFHLRRLHEQWKRNPIVEASLPELVRLKRELSRSDWDAFRDLLLIEIAPMMRAVDFRVED